MAESHVPTRKNRERRALIRHRASLMRIRVEIKNRIHALLDKHELTYPQTDLFGKEGMEWLRNQQLPNPDNQILQSNPQILQTVNAEIRNARSPQDNMTPGCESSMNESNESMDPRKPSSP